jgi:hypothetical protein
MSSVASTRKERIIIEAVNNAVRENQRNPINIVSGGLIIEGIKSSAKYSGGQSAVARPYADIVLSPKTATNIKVSLRDTSTIAMYGEDHRTINVLVPGIVNRFLRKVKENLDASGLKTGDQVPPIFGLVGPRDKMKLLIGSSVTGGPIDYMYVGPTDVKATYDKASNRLTLNGSMVDPKTYSKEIQLYIGIRPGIEDQRYDSDAVDQGMPKIYGKSPTRGFVDNRIFLTDIAPSTARIVNL